MADLLVLLGAAAAATGLAFRLPSKSVPRRILTPTGTPPGLIVGVVIYLIGVLLASVVLRAVGTGVLAFAVGASTLALVNHWR